MNIWELNESLIFTINLTSKHRKIAQKLSQDKLTLEHAKTFYYHILAICAVKDYLDLLEYETDWRNSEFHNPIMSTFADVVDLEIKHHGKLECRAVFADDYTQIPEDAWSNRIGYIFVNIDEFGREARIMGFVSSVQKAEGVVNLNQLRSLEEFPQYLDQIKQAQVISIGESIKEKVVILSQWLQQTTANIEQEWQNAENLLMRQPQKLSYMTRNSSEAINKAKVINLKLNLATQAVMLLMTVTPQSQEKLKIRARLCPIAEENYLPSGLRLEILSPSEETLKLVKSELRDYFIQLPEFTGELGDKFKLRIAIGDVSLIEEFMI